MTTDSSSTTDDGSEIVSRVSDALSKAQKSRCAADAERLAKLLARIRDLESRGFIRRQRYYAPTTVEFERRVQTGDAANNWLQTERAKERFGNG